MNGGFVEVTALGQPLRWAAVEADEPAWLAVYVDKIAVVTREAHEAHYWFECESASWDGRSDTLTVRFMDPSVDPFAVKLADERDAKIALIVRERLERSIVHRSQRELPSGAIARGLVRRGVSDELFTQVFVDGVAGELSETDEAELETLEAGMRDVVGLPRE